MNVWGEGEGILLELEPHACGVLVKTPYVHNFHKQQGDYTYKAQTK